jgi:hypothetical protein
VVVAVDTTTVFVVVYNIEGADKLMPMNQGDGLLTHANQKYHDQAHWRY